ncbi:MAG: hypothetical protein ABIJ10_02210 [Candidatus Micrarchaeota archaeon]
MSKIPIDPREVSIHPEELARAEKLRALYLVSIDEGEREIIAAIKTAREEDRKTGSDLVHAILRIPELHETTLVRIMEESTGTYPMIVMGVIGKSRRRSETRLTNKIIDMAISKFADNGHILFALLSCETENDVHRNEDNLLREVSKLMEKGPTEDRIRFILNFLGFSNLQMNGGMSKLSEKFLDDMMDLLVQHNFAAVIEYLAEGDIFSEKTRQLAKMRLDMLTTTGTKSLVPVVEEIAAGPLKINITTFRERQPTQNEQRRAMKKVLR